ncbi:tRNA-i(6)A37 modification protein MiaB [Novosphingobium sp. Rr 2-17]|nr:tRNA-i(6)A37 modification protein MiaB [Novosphingobium sp. Rr 2-17]
MQSTTLPKTYRVKSFGCQMNVYDGDRMAELLAEQGIAPAPDGEDADLVVLNPATSANARRKRSIPTSVA